MANLGKKILSAFIEVNDDKKPEAEKPPETKESYQPAKPQPTASYTGTAAGNSYASTGNSKFKEYFDKLFKEANIPGPDYFEFSKMIEAMQAVPDEQVRYITAFAGLSVQGLDKQKLLATLRNTCNCLKPTPPTSIALLMPHYRKKCTRSNGRWKKKKNAFNSWRRK